MIRSAFLYAEEHHRGQNRKDGSPFVTHPLAVAQIVAEELHLDSESIAAALLHDTIEDTDATHEDIARTFSPTVADIGGGRQQADPRPVRLQGQRSRWRTCARCSWP
ncbi:MAG: HD domain-containing protein [Oscillospiraceae bacterium]